MSPALIQTYKKTTCIELKKENRVKLEKKIPNLKVREREKKKKEVLLADNTLASLEKNNLQLPY